MTLACADSSIVVSLPNKPPAGSVVGSVGNCDISGIIMDPPNHTQLNGYS